MKKITRRTILRSMGLGLLFTQLVEGATTIFKDSHCKPQNSKKVLVVYASEYGSTQEVAEAIGQSLCSSEIGVDVKYVKNITHVDGYEQVIVGSPIQYDTWMSETKDFLKKYEKDLSQVSVSYFFTCLTLSKVSEKTKKQAQGYADELLKLNTKVEPQSIGQFAGVLDYGKFSFSFRLLARTMFAILGVKEGDYRDWEAIKLWAEEIKLKG